MSSIVIHPKDKEELALISKLLKKMGVKSRILTESDLEDLGLSLLMKEANRDEIVAEEEILYKLTKNES